MNEINFSLDSMKEFLEEPFKKGSVMKFLMMLAAGTVADVLIFALMFAISSLIGVFITFFRLDFSGKPLAVVLFIMPICIVLGYCMLRLLIFADIKLFGTTESGTKDTDANAGKFNMLMVVISVIAYVIIATVHIDIFSVIDHRMYNGFVLANPGLLAALFMLRPVTRGNELLRKRIKTVLMFLFWIITVIAWWPIIPMLT